MIEDNIIEDPTLQSYVKLHRAIQADLNSMAYNEQEIASRAMHRFADYLIVRLPEIQKQSYESGRKDGFDHALRLTIDEAINNPPTTPMPVPDGKLGVVMAQFETTPTEFDLLLPTMEYRFTLLDNGNYIHELISFIDEMPPGALRSDEV